MSTPDPLLLLTPAEQAFWDRAVCAALAGLTSQKSYIRDGSHFPDDVVADAVSIAEALLALRRGTEPPDTRN